MRRRQFIVMVSFAAVASPLGAHAQGAMPVVGVLSGVPAGATVEAMKEFREGLATTGFIPGQNVSIVYRAADDREGLSKIAAEFVKEGVAVIAAINGTASGFAAKTATTTIPVVFMMGADPVKIGLVSSINHPGGNVTGVSFLANGLGAKRLEILHELVPTAERIGFLLNPQNPSATEDAKDMKRAAVSLRLTLDTVNASNDQELTEAFQTLTSLNCHALVLSADAFFSGRDSAIAALASAHMLPTIYFLSRNAAAGGLISYGTDLPDATRQAGVYVGRILKGENPGELPVIQATKFEMVINLKTAKALGLTIPPTLLALANEVIE
jgi:putative tryptophan/tyrosine transport system substrate-binding protein